MQAAGAGWRRWPWSLPAVPTGVGLLELALVRLAGPPTRQVETLRQLGEGGTDPVAPLLALLALGAQGLAAYLLLVLGLRLLALLPGALGRLAAGAALRVTPVAVRRALDLVLGGALMAQVTLGSLPARAAATPPPLAAVRSTTVPAGRPPAPLPPWLSARPQRRSPGLAGPETAPVPTPAGSGAAPTTQPAVPGGASARTPGGPGATSAIGPGAEGLGSTNADGDDTIRDYTIRVGDTLWGIAAAHLPPAKRSAAAVDRYWRQLYRANRAVLGPDPDLIHPGTRLRLPPDRSGRR
jgi:LysM domain